VVDAMVSTALLESPLMTLEEFFAWRPEYPGYELHDETDANASSLSSKGNWGVSSAFSWITLSWIN
jgi:hypothetical protein